MTTTAPRRALPFARPLLGLLALLTIAGAASAQTWDYKAYKKDRYGQYSKDNFYVATVSIEEKDGAWQFRMIAPQLDACYRSPLPATVVKDETQTTITVTDVIAGCEAFRYFIRNDGSGGRKEFLRGGAWVADGWERGLTPTKK